MLGRVRSPSLEDPGIPLELEHHWLEGWLMGIWHPTVEELNPSLERLGGTPWRALQIVALRETIIYKIFK